MRKDSHILCSERNDTKLGQGAMHGKGAAGIQLKLAFDPVNQQTFHLKEYAFQKKKLYNTSK